jgi:DNA-binding transcriptional LysR family regulator
MGRLEAFGMFVGVADHGGFAAAARALNVSPPAVTRGIAALESHLGVMLFHRSTRAVSLTDEGVRLLERVRPLLAELADAERQARGARAEPSGQLYVTAPVAFGRLHVLPVVTELLDRHPGLDIRMMLIDRNVRIVEEGIDVAVRIGELTDSSLKAIRIGAVRQAIVASPAYLARHGAPDRPEALAGHNIIATTGPRAADQWRFGERGGTRVTVKPRLLLNTVDSTIAAAEAGAGIANLLSYQAVEGLAAGRLIEILRPDAPARIPVHLLFEASRGKSPATRAFLDAMSGRAAGQGWSR